MEGNNNSMVDNINREIANYIERIDQLNNAVIAAIESGDETKVKMFKEERDALEAKKEAKEKELREVLLKGKCYNYIYCSMFKTN